MTPLRQMVVDAALTLSARPLRTAAMVIGIVLGVASATAAVLIADTQQVQINERFDAQRSNRVVLTPEVPPHHFDREALAEYPATSPAIHSASEVSIWSDDVAVSTLDGAPPVARATVVGISPTVLDATGSTLRAGAPPDVLSSMPPDAAVAWVGQDLATRLGITGREPRTLSMYGSTFSVAGVIGTEAGFGYLNSSVLIPAPRAYALLGRAQNSRAIIHVRPGSAAAVAEHARIALDPGQQLALRDMTPPDGEILVGNVSADLRRIGLALGAFLGFIGMVSVANTLSMSVFQRTRELGLRSAIGWSRRRIGGLVLTESLVAGCLASLVGCALGMAVAWGWCLTQGWTLIIWPALAPLAITGGVVATVIGGLIPANRAASISPMTALRN